QVVVVARARVSVADGAVARTSPAPRPLRSAPSAYVDGAGGGGGAGTVEGAGSAGAAGAAGGVGSPPRFSTLMSPFTVVIFSSYLPPFTSPETRRLPGCEWMSSGNAASKSPLTCVKSP